MRCDIVMKKFETLSASDKFRNIMNAKNYLSSKPLPVECKSENGVLRVKVEWSADRKLESRVESAEWSVESGEWRFES